MEALYRNMNRYVITKQNFRGREYTISALYDENKKMLEACPVPAGSSPVLGNIYIGRVENVVQNLNAAFVKISAEQTCYLPLEDLKYPVFTKKLSEKKLITAGDELLVQVSKEAVKTKEPTVTTNLNFTGKYVVLTSGNRNLSVSSKLSKEKREHFKELLETRTDFLHDCGIIVRTNAAEEEDTVILEEASAIFDAYQALRKAAEHKTAYSILKTSPEPYLKELADIPQNTLEQIVTDDRTVFEKICTFYGIGEEQWRTKGSVPAQVCEFKTASGILLRHYTDASYSLNHLYSITENLSAALNEKVWLKSGAYLIIQPTEALTVIDVNTGKNIEKKNMQENILKVNKEAAAEIAGQLRLRNISGMILVDFINLTSKEAEWELMKFFHGCLKADSTPAQLVDMTKLGLVELTRKKKKKSLKESLFS